MRTGPAVVAGSSTRDLPVDSDAGSLFTWAARLIGGEPESHNAMALPLDGRPPGEADALAGERSWQVLVQHQAGSVEAAVTAGRRRNLWLSFGLLSVLVAGMVLVVANARRAERLAAQQVDFVAAVSHELRTPLTVMRTAAQNLSSGAVRDPEHARSYGVLIEQEGRRLTEMVEQVLGYAGIDALGRGSRTTDVELPTLVESVVHENADLFSSHGIAVEVRAAASLPAVAIDEAALRRALQNLITNAVKYGAIGRWIGVRIEPSRWQGQPAVSVAVSDRGPGIESADLPHVFEPFYRGRRAAAQQAQGSGIGLSLVKKVAEAHGGHIAVSSTSAGATFTLQIPAAPGTELA